MNDHAVRVQRVKHARFKRERDMWLSDAIRPAVCFGYRAANIIFGITRIVALSVLAGAGFGVGLALASALAGL